MTIFRWTAWSILAAVALSAGDARALDQYCRADYVRVQDGGEYQVKWDIVNSKARRPQLPGQTRATTGCNNGWRSLGAFYRPLEIIQAPKLGRARVTGNYRLFYESARNGQDAVAIRVHWIQASTGKLQSAVVRYNITVTDHPL
jgi:hypothetical protein